MNEASVNKAVLDLDGKTLERVNATMEARRRGSKLAARFEAMEDDYRSFYYMLGGGPDKRVRVAEGNKPSVTKLAIVLANDYEHPRWGTGRLVAAFSRNPNPHILGPHYYTQVNFEEHDNPGSPKFVQSESFGMNVLLQEMTPLRREKLRAMQPGIVLMPGDYTPDTVEELGAQLETVLPDAQATFNLLLAKACDPTLNPDLAPAAQAYRDDLASPN